MYFSVDYQTEIIKQPQYVYKQNLIYFIGHQHRPQPGHKSFCGFNQVDVTFMLHYAIYLYVGMYVRIRHSNMGNFNNAANVKGPSQFRIETNHRKQTIYT